MRLLDFLLGAGLAGLLRGRRGEAQGVGGGNDLDSSSNSLHFILTARLSKADKLSAPRHCEELGNFSLCSVPLFASIQFADGAIGVMLSLCTVTEVIGGGVGVAVVIVAVVEAASWDDDDDDDDDEEEETDTDGVWFWG